MTMISVEKENSSVIASEKSGIIKDETTNDISSAAKAPLKKRVDESPEAMANESSANQDSSTSRARNNPTTDSAGNLFANAWYREIISAPHVTPGINDDLS